MLTVYTSGICQIYSGFASTARKGNTDASENTSAALLASITTNNAPSWMHLRFVR
jgi:hypothetical protein